MSERNGLDNTTEDAALELYKLEYERCSIRYEDIYRAIWTNFSYLTVVSGAILAFGSNQLDIMLASFIACFPLLFWYWATYRPMDKYANDTLKTLESLESTLNSKYPVKLQHYSNFLKTKESRGAGGLQPDKSQVHIRARTAIQAFFFFLHVIVIVLSYRIYEGNLIFWLMAIGIYCLYITTHLGTDERKRVVNAIVLTVAGVALFFLLVKTPEPKRTVDVKHIVVTNEKGMITAKEQGEEGQTFVIQLVGIEGLVLKEKQDSK